jgi:hypothetical protein
MDILSNVFSLLRTQGHVYGRLDPSGPVGMGIPRQHGCFLAVIQGKCFLNIGNSDLVELSVGDFAFLPTTDVFYLRSEREIEGSLLIGNEQFARFASTRKLVHRFGEGPVASLISCCFTFSSPESDLFIELLPRMTHIKRSDADPSAQHLMAIMRDEIVSERPWAAAILDRLVEVLLLQVTRRCFNGSDGAALPGWLAALGDRKIISALKLMRADLGAPWTVEEVARHVGMSRAAFAARFKAVVG